METEGAHLEDQLKGMNREERMALYRSQGVLVEESTRPRAPIITEDTILVRTCGGCGRSELHDENTGRNYWGAVPEELWAMGDIKPTHGACPICKETEDIILGIERGEIKRPNSEYVMAERDY